MYYADIIKKTLKNEKAALILFISGSILMNIYYSIQCSTGFKIYPLVLNTFLLSTYVVYKFFTYKKLYKCLDEGVSSPQYHGEDNSFLADIIDNEKAIHRNYISEISKLNDTIKERDLMLIEWIHNMKTSVSVISLAIEGLDSKECKDIKYENELLRANLENALNIFRMDEFSTDYVPERINLNKIIKEVVNSEKSTFIYSKVFPKNKVDDTLTVYSDKKWLKFIIRQLISNSVKYSSENNTILIFTEEDDKKLSLHIKDNGIGIKESEIMRIFEPFFTGTNGRTTDKSSGMGLYLVKKICDKLQITVDVMSSIGEGSDFILIFNKNNIE